MSRDLRDPIKLGERYLMLRKKGVDIDVAVEIPVGNYEDGGFISSNPADHHSKVDQRMNWQEGADATD